MTSPQQETLVRSLRELCCWYEWAEPPNLEIAGILQDAADGLASGTLSLPAARATLAAWQPFVGVEARVGNQPQLVAVATTEEGIQRGIIAHMRSMIAQSASTEQRLHLMELLEEQARIFGSGVDRG